MDEQRLLDRIEKLEKDVEFLFKSNNDNREKLARIETKLDYLTATIDEMRKSIKELSEKPGRRWDNLITAGLTATITGIVAFFIGKLTR
jgi:peptidoglycan hydrolase CwlO-like protein